MDSSSFFARRIHILIIMRSRANQKHYFLCLPSHPLTKTKRLWPAIVLISTHSPASSLPWLSSPLTCLDLPDGLFPAPIYHPTPHGFRSSSAHFIQLLIAYHLSPVAFRTFFLSFFTSRLYARAVLPLPTELLSLSVFDISPEDSWLFILGLLTLLLVLVYWASCFAISFNEFFTLLLTCDF